MVPTYLAANRDRVHAFQKAWSPYVSPGRALYYQDHRAQAIVEAQGGNSPLDAVTQMRTLWT